MVSKKNLGFSNYQQKIAKLPEAIADIQGKSQIDRLIRLTSIKIFPKS